MILKKYNFLLVVQARTESKRLPKKVIKKLSNSEIISIILKRLKKCKNVDKIIVATCKDKYYEKLIKILNKNNIDCFVGSKKNVLKRFYDLSKKYNTKNIVRITADCPLVDWKIIDSMIGKFKRNKFDYFCNTNPRTFPDGLDVEIFTMKALKASFDKSVKNFDKEHVTSFIINSNKFKKSSISYSKNFGNIRFTIDNQKDYYFFKKVFNNFYPNIFFSWKDVINMNIKFNYNK